MSSMNRQSSTTATNRAHLNQRGSANRCRSLFGATVGFLLMMFAPTAIAVKCVQAGYAPSEGGMWCIPSKITYSMFGRQGGWGISSTDTIFSSETEAIEHTKSLLSGPPRCVVSTDDGAPIDIDGVSWGDMGAWEDVEYTTRTGYGGVYISYPSGCSYTSPIRWGVQQVQWAECPIPPDGGADWFYASQGGDNSMVCYRRPTAPSSCQETQVGNPIDVLDGEKIQDELILAGRPSGALGFGIHYASLRRYFQAPAGGDQAYATKHPLMADGPAVWLGVHQSSLAVMFQ